MSQLQLVASAISSIIESPVKTYDECIANGLKIDPSQILDLDTIHKRSLRRINEEELEFAHSRNMTACGSSEQACGSSEQIQIFVKPLESHSQSMFVDPSITVLEFKKAICAKFDYDIETIRLIFCCKQLNDHNTLASYEIKKGCTIQVLSRVVGGIFYVIKSDLLDPSYDFDFTYLKDNGTNFIRGKELYKRPYGWKRIALNVRKYGNDNTWLGCVGNSPHEWPVSYHGTKKEFAESIANEGYLVSKGKRFAYGVGIYSSPDIRIAEQFAEEFDHNNVRYKVIFQNRVNPEGFQRRNNDKYWVTPKDENIRPYGLCIKRTAQQCSTS
ncbi:hypothetical protein C1646_310306 [Rhizophagus diaphanus]|nr:hypothetical protein C1646_310306 [Rhizophagus diaphanus] [Rhizophagus sp. MUCL 43196]